MAASGGQDTTAFKKLEQKRFPPVQHHETAEGRYWRRFRRPQVTNHSAPCTHVHFCPVPPHDVAVTTSLAVKTFDAGCRRQKKALTRFNDVAYSGQWRHDGKLIAAGGNEGVVRTFEVQSATALRTLTGHKAAVRTVRWSLDGLKLLSGSDDSTVRLWDVATADTLVSRQGHRDYVRAVAASPTAPDSWVSGGYDHKVCLWDMRQKGSSVFEVDHGAPVEALLFLPGGSMVVSAGGNYLKVWDVLKAGRLLQALSNHQKTITSLCLDATQSRFLSGSLDGHVKIYSAQSFAVTHGLKYQAAIISMGISPNNTHLLVATSDGALTVRKREVKSESGPKQRAIRPEHVTKGTAKYFARGKNVAPATDDYQVAVQRKQRLKPYDSALRKFRYHDALDAALASRNPLVVVTVLEELVHRGGLDLALSGRDEVTLEPILSFLARYTTNPRFAELLVEVSSSVFTLYTPVLGQSEAIDELFTKLGRQVKAELKCQRKMLELMGAMDAILSSTPAAPTLGQEDAAAAAISEA